MIPIPVLVRKSGYAWAGTRFHTTIRDFSILSRALSEGSKLLSEKVVIDSDDENPLGLVLGLVFDCARAGPDRRALPLAPLCGDICS
jgi:hypothetical protein